MRPAYVKPHAQRGKTAANVAAAIRAAVTRPTMRFVQVKSTERQAALALHRTRDLPVKQRTQLENMTYGLLADFGMARGLRHALELASRLVDRVDGFPDSDGDEGKPIRLPLDHELRQFRPDLSGWEDQVAGHG
ncbi:hypothetical protein SAMN05192568_100414 [Methylobacterium pseudosasicola]|uniref:Uncharacterized protein n=1 Tax=Methylobacterium pseudosasicola TaxID=582667 RepID=A0A1I4H3S7_9HYPH|nr:hypothetical protein SAMN05192568_100414 [Methylobacterium pseudosasicola]